MTPGAPPKTKIYIHNQRLVVVPPPDLLNLCKTLPDRVHLPKAGGYSVAPTAFMAERLVKLFQEHGAEPDEGFMRLWAAREAVNEANARRGNPFDGYDFVTKPWEHQRRALDFAYALESSCLFMHMGTGKTKVIIDLIRNRQHARTLIVTKKRAAYVWASQAKVHARPDDSLDVRVLTDMPMNERHDWLEMTPRGDRPVIFVTNYDALVPKRGQKVNYFAERLRREWFDLVVMDESHSIKKPGGVISKFASTLRDRAGQRVAMTGTLMPNSPLDIYGQFRFLDPGLFGTMAEFESRYVIRGGWMGQEVLGFDNIEELARRWGQLTFEAGAEVLGRDKPTHVEVPLRLDEKARKIYASLRDEMAAEIGAGVVTANNILTKTLRLQQLTSGMLPVTTVDDDGVETATPTVVDTAKAEALLETLEGLDPKEKVVVYGVFYHDLNVTAWAAGKAARPAFELSGRRDDQEAWRAAPPGAVLAVQLKAGGAGVDLTAAHVAIYYTVNHSLGDFDQSLSRVDRPPQDRPVIFYYLQARGTMDRTIMRALVEKRSVVDAVVDEMRSIYAGQTEEGDYMA